MIPALVGASLGSGIPASNFYSIQTVTVGAGGQSTAIFNSIPSTYTHLQIRYMALPSSTAAGYRIRMQLNSDSGNNYATHLLYGSGSGTPAAAAAATTNQMTVGANVQSTATTSPAVGIVDILDYANTSKYKTVRSLCGDDSNGSGEIDFNSGLWMNSNAVSTITLYFDTANLAQYSSFALYGVK